LSALILFSNLKEIEILQINKSIAEYAQKSATTYSTSPYNDPGRRSAHDTRNLKLRIFLDELAAQVAKVRV
jgi:hypothetical protein